MPPSPIQNSPLTFPLSQENHLLTFSVDLVLARLSNCLCFTLPSSTYYNLYNHSGLFSEPPTYHVPHTPFFSIPGPRSSPRHPQGQFPHFIQVSAVTASQAFPYHLSRKYSPLTQIIWLYSSLTVNMKALYLSCSLLYPLPRTVPGT